MELALKALESNKEDTQNAVSLWCEAIISLKKAETNNNETLEKYNNLLELNTEKEKILKNRDMIVNILIPTLSLIPVGMGLLEYSNNTELAKKYIITGVGCFVGCELIYQGGKLVFRIW